jgi:hypothetical protein
MPGRQRLTAEDQHMADWVARWAPVTAMQLARRFDRPTRRTYRRIKVLREYGLLDLSPRDAGLPGAIYPTKRVIGRAPRRLPADQLAGHFAVVQHAIELENAGRLVATRHELPAIADLEPTIPKHDGRALVPAAVVIDHPRCAIYCAVRGSEEGKSTVVSLTALSEPPALQCRLLLEPDALPVATRPPWLETCHVDLADVADPGR